MSLSNLKASDAEQIGLIPRHEGAEPYEQTFDDREVLPLAVNRKARHLNVDEVLARSLPKVTDKARNSDGEKNLAGI